MLRVGRCTYDKGKRIDPKYPGYKSILVMMKSHSNYWSLSPYYLKDEKGYIFENIWQACKLYEKVPKSVQYYSQYDKRVIWQYPFEVHLTKEFKLTPAYFNWRKELMENEYAVRYPVGYSHRHKCLYSLLSKENGYDLTSFPGTLEKLDYVEARKRIYQPVYQKLARQQPLYQKLLTSLTKGENLLIIEVDGPHSESLPYYQEKYSVTRDFIDNETMLVTEQNLDIMLNDEKHCYGHGYCLAAALYSNFLSLSVKKMTRTIYYTQVVSFSILHLPKKLS